MDVKGFKQEIGPSEYEMGKIIVDAAVEAGIKHAVHASLPAATKLTNGKVPVLAFDGEIPQSLSFYEDIMVQKVANWEAMWCRQGGGV